MNGWSRGACPGEAVDELTPAERRRADAWIARQFKLKNDHLRNKRLGILMLDRTPLDPLAFAEAGQWRGKARALLRAIGGDHANWDVEPGKVIVLGGESSELAMRMLLTGREGYTEARLEKMAGKLSDLFDGTAGVTRIDTRGLSAGEVAKRIAQVVHSGTIRSV